MKRIRIARLLLLFSGLIACLLWQGCAQQFPPQGGPKDLNPPVLIASLPENFSVGFHSKKIELVFDEFIRLKNPRENLIFSPVMKNDPDFLVKGKKLVITLYDTLMENTTYTINFNDAITDITEENPLSGFRYIFSTGTYIDSMKVSGKIINAYTLKPEKNVIFMIYESFDDSIPYKEPPRYIAKTNDEGLYNLTNIKKGTYKVFALNDLNKNYMADPDEAIGFSDSTIRIETDTVVPQVNLVLFMESPKKQYLKRYNSRQHGQFMVKYNLPVPDLQLREMNGQFTNRQLLREENESRDSLNFWINPPDHIDSIRLQLIAHDTLVDTVFLSIPEKRKKEKAAQISTNADKGESFDLNQPLKIFSDVPAVLDTSKVLLKEDSIFIYPVWQLADSAKKTYAASHPWKEDSRYQLTILQGALVNIYGNENDSLTVNIVTRELKYYGTLKIQLKNLEDDAVLLLTQNTAIADTRLVGPLKNEVYYNYLQPGEYGLIIIYDTNGNGKWDTGDYFQHRQPERVTIHSGAITIRSNWDQEIEWILE